MQHSSRVRGRDYFWLPKSSPILGHTALAEKITPKIKHNNPHQFLIFSLCQSIFYLLPTSIKQILNLAPLEVYK